MAISQRFGPNSSDSITRIKARRCAANLVRLVKHSWGQKLPEINMVAVIITFLLADLNIITAPSGRASEASETLSGLNEIMEIGDICINMYVL